MDRQHVWWHADHPNHWVGHRHCPTRHLESDSDGHSNGSGHLVCRHVVGIRLGPLLRHVSLAGVACGGGLWPVLAERPVFVRRPRHEGSRHRHDARGARWHGVGVPRKGVARRGGRGVVCGAPSRGEPRPNDLLPLVPPCGHHGRSVGAWSRVGPASTNHEGDGTSVGRWPARRLAANGPACRNRTIFGIHDPG